MALHTFAAYTFSAYTFSSIVFGGSIVWWPPLVDLENVSYVDSQNGTSSWIVTIDSGFGIQTIDSGFKIITIDGKGVR